MEVIAEIGTSFAKNLQKAIDMVGIAKECGADTVKFQLVYAKEILHKKTGMVPLPSGNIDLYQAFKELEINLKIYADLKKECEKIGINFLCSCFGIKSAKELLQIGVNRIKIASPELNHIPLLEFLSTKDIELILSTGVSKLSDIELALDTAAPNKKSLLHCIVSYPAPEIEYNLAILNSYKNIFGIDVGVSDHSLSPFIVPCITKILGGDILEKHFTLSNKEDGLDDKIALNPKNFKLMTDRLKEAKKAPLFRIEDDLPKEFDGLVKEFGLETIKAVIGTSVKKLAKSEQDNYLRTNRSIHALGNIKKGDVFCLENIAVLRTEKVLSVGLHPKFFNLIIGKVSKKDIEEGEGINWENLI